MEYLENNDAKKSGRFNADEHQDLDKEQYLLKKREFFQAFRERRDKTLKDFRNDLPQNEISQDLEQLLGGFTLDYQTLISETRKIFAQKMKDYFEIDLKGDLEKYLSEEIVGKYIDLQNSSRENGGNETDEKDFLQGLDHEGNLKYLEKLESARKRGFFTILEYDKATGESCWKSNEIVRMDPCRQELDEKKCEPIIEEKAENEKEKEDEKEAEPAENTESEGAEQTKREEEAEEKKETGSVLSDCQMNEASFVYNDHVSTFREQSQAEISKIYEQSIETGTGEFSVFVKIILDLASVLESLSRFFVVYFQISWLWKVL